MHAQVDEYELRWKKNFILVLCKETNIWIIKL
jgi:hypothetical protein